MGSNGSHGLGNTNNATTPTKISGLSNIVQISAGYNDTMFVDSNGNAYHTGSNTNSISSLGAARTSPAQMTVVTNCAQILCNNTYYYNGNIGLMLITLTHQETYMELDLHPMVHWAKETQLTNQLGFK